MRRSFFAFKAGLALPLTLFFARSHGLITRFCKYLRSALCEYLRFVLCGYLSSALCRSLQFFLLCRRSFFWYGSARGEDFCEKQSFSGVARCNRLNILCGCAMLNGNKVCAVGFSGVFSRRESALSEALLSARADRGESVCYREHTLLPGG